jgi:hypothetical protein
MYQIAAEGMRMFAVLMKRLTCIGRAIRNGANSRFSLVQLSILGISLIFSLRFVFGLVHLQPKGCLGQGSQQSQTEKEGLIKQESQTICRVAFHPSYDKNRYMVVGGTITGTDVSKTGTGNSGNNYPVILDTGASQSVFLTVRHINENGLTVYTRNDETAASQGIEQTNLNGYNLGRCILQQLQIGNIQIVNWPGLYLENRKHAKLLGINLPLTVAADNAIGENNIILGLPMLRQFKYIEFDSINKNVELSYSQVFDPPQQGWDSYRLFIEEDFHGNAYLFVRIPVAGVEVELQLDTGSGRGLALGEKLWSQIQSSAPGTKDIKLKQGKEFYPYIGKLNCRRGTSAELKVGNQNIKNAEIAVFADDCPLLADCGGMIGMQCFQDTVIVLDFERSLLWVINKKTPGDTGG